MKQLSHIEISNEQRSFPVTLVCDELRTPENIGMCFRVAESFGVDKIFIHKNSPSTQNRIVQRTARNTINTVPFDIYTDFKNLIHQLKNEGNVILGLEITDQSTNIREYDFTKHSKIVILLGSERKGINDISLLDGSISIPMYGKNSSMNVVHSLAITLYELTNQLKMDYKLT